MGSDSVRHRGEPAPCPHAGLWSGECERARGHVVTVVLIALFALLLTAISYGRMARAYPSAESAFLRWPGNSSRSRLRDRLGHGNGTLYGKWSVIKQERSYSFSLYRLGGGVNGLPPQATHRFLSLLKPS